MDYFYEHESELFTFYRVPKVLFTEEPFKNMNCEAKLLYGLLLDKMGLSRKSGWFDKQGRAFVYYGISHIMEDLGCAHNKAEKLLSELEQAGLLRRKRQGLGKAALKIGQAVYRGLPVRANAFSQQLRKGQNGLALT